jgi:hypothetical protein
VSAPDPLVIPEVAGVIAVLVMVYRWLVRGARQREEVQRQREEVEHRRAVELKLAEQGVMMWGLAAGARPVARPEFSGQPATEWTLPAAVVPTPPGARPHPQGTPGPCRHEQIIPVFDGDGKTLRWICANHQRCDAWFPPGIAIYEPNGETSA